MAQQKFFDAHLKPMLAKNHKAPFSDPEWLFEVKLDGYRIIAESRGGSTCLLSRNGLNYSKKYPAIIKILNTMKEDVILDGEMVVLDEEGKPDFDALQNVSRQKASALVYYEFDVLYYKGKFTMKERVQTIGDLFKPVLDAGIDFGAIKLG